MADHYDVNHWNDGLGHTVWREPLPEHSKLLGPDGRPLPYRQPKFGFDLTPRKEKPMPEENKATAYDRGLQAAEPVLRTVEDHADKIHRLVRELNITATALCGMDPNISVEFDTTVNNVFGEGRRDDLSVHISKKL